MKKIVTFLSLFIFAYATSQTLEEQWWVPNGSVLAIHKVGNTVYLGGTFTAIGTSYPYGALADSNTGIPDFTIVKPNGTVNCSLPDGNGGWYIGGYFTNVGGQVRNRLARINPDGTLHAWNPDADNIVTAMAIIGNTVYVAGYFANIGGQVRSRLAAVDTSTALVNEWNPGSNGIINTMSSNGSTLYIGGSFTTIGGLPRTRIAALDSATGAVSSWNPQSSSTVYASAYYNNTLYVGGFFSTIGGAARNNIAALDTTTGNALSWYPETSSSVFALSISNGTVYIGGNFTTVLGQPRNNLAAVNIQTGNLSSWNPNANNGVTAIEVSGNTVYAAGGFTTIGGQERLGIAALNGVTGIATAFNPSANGIINTIAVNSNSVYFGGGFTGLNAVVRNSLAAIDAATGILTSWNPGANNIINSIGVNESVIYVGGGFTVVGGQNRNRIAAINAATGLATAWNPDASSGISTLALNENILYAGGAFTSIGGQARNRIAAINTATGLATAWNPNAGNGVNEFAFNGSTVYAGGVFTTMGGQSRNRVAAINKATGAVEDLNPNVSANVNTIALGGNELYIGGLYQSIGGVAKNRLAAVNTTTGSPTSWNPDAIGTVSALLYSAGKIFVGGAFSQIAGVSRTAFAVFSTCTLTATATQTNANAYGAANGTATAVPTGGTAPYTYSWNTTPAQTTATATGLAAGTYTVTVTDAVGCIKTVNVTITEPAMCAITTTWDGTAWSNGTPTSNGFTAVIEGDLDSTGNIAACSLTINSGAVTINSGNNLTIKGAVTVSGGSLTFEDNANLIQTDDVANSGSITYKKLGSNLHYLDYTLWSSPTTGVQTLKQFSNGTLDERFYVYNTALGVWSNHTSPSGIFGSNPNAVTFAEAKGYLIRMPEGQDPAQTAVFEGVFIGEPNNGDISIAAPAGFNAIGNPYPSPINIHNFIDENEGLLDNEGALYFWRKTNNATATTYSTINKLAYVANDADGGDTGTGYFNLGQEASWVISPAQGFLVKSLGGTVNFTNDMRRAVNTGQFFRTANNDSDESVISRYWLNITGANNSFGQMAVAYTPAATLGLDYGLDARLVNDGALALYSLAATKNLAIQARPAFVNTDIVSLGYKATTAGTYTIALNQFDGLFTGNQGIYLKDNTTGTVHDIKASEYSFTTIAGTFTNRLEVVYANGALGTNNPVLDEAGIVIYKQGNTLHADSQNAIINSVMVYDITGRLLYNVQDINSLHADAVLNVQQQVLVVHVKTVSGQVVCKKVLF